MKITIGANLFKPFHRQDLCIETLRRLKEQFPDTIELVNIQFPDEMFEYDGFETVPCLKKDSRLVNPEGEKRKPWIREMFDGIADCKKSDFFIFTNSDILISDRYIQMVIDNPGIDSFPASRLAIEAMETLESPVIPIVYQIVGFDTYAMKTSWWKTARHHFPDYIYAEPSWDVHYLVLSELYGNTMIANRWPPPIFHPEHPREWEGQYPERQYNDKLFWVTHEMHGKMWNTYLFQYLFKRTPQGCYYDPLPHEDEIEQKFWNQCRQVAKKQK